MKITRREILTMLMALDDGIRDREGYVAAWTPKFGKSNAKSRRIVRQTHATIARYQKLQQRLREEITSQLSNVTVRSQP